MLRRAQTAVLNPGTDAQEFVTMSAKELKHLGRNQLQFSRNTVCIDLSGPELTDLAFIDLPGAYENGEEHGYYLLHCKRHYSKRSTGHCRFGRGGSPLSCHRQLYYSRDIANER